MATSANKCPASFIIWCKVLHTLTSCDNVVWLTRQKLNNGSSLLGSSLLGSSLLGSSLLGSSLLGSLVLFIITQ